MTTPQLPPGQYTDPEGVTRFWDGTTWLTAAPAKASTSRPWLWIVLAGVALIAVVGTCAYFVLADRADRAAETQATMQAAVDAEKAERVEAERVEAENAAASTELAMRKDTVVQLEEAALKTANERVEAGLYEDKVLRVSCMPSTGSSISELEETSTTFSCLAVTKDNDDGTSSGYAMEGLVNWSNGEMSWG